MNQLLKHLDLQNPIIQAPMAGGPTTVDLVAAVSEAGSLGSFGAAYVTPEQLRNDIDALRERTARPFSVNLFSPLPDPPPFAWETTLRQLQRFHDELGLPPPEPVAPYSQLERFNALLDVVVDRRVPVVSFTFGLPPSGVIERLHKSGAFVVGTATTVDEARAFEGAGADAVVAQGSEAGGHRGTFLASYQESLIGTMALVPQMVDAVRIPVIASGGIMDGRGIVAALALGASAVQMGTAFVTVTESGAPQAHKEAILHASDRDTTITRAFSGRAARGIANRFTRAFANDEAAIGPYPFQNDATRPMRRAGASAGRAEVLSLWSGQAPRLARSERAADLISRLLQESAATVQALEQRELGVFL